MMLLSDATMVLLQDHTSTTRVAFFTIVQYILVPLMPSDRINACEPG
jgi:hypothetical protein